MILTTDEVEKIFVAVMESITGLPSGRVILEAKAGPRPSDLESGGLYCTLDWKGFEPLPQNEGDYTIADQATVPSDPFVPLDSADKAKPIIQHLHNETYCTLEISFWGKGAFSRAASSIGHLQNDNRIFDLWRVLGFCGINGIKDGGRSFEGKRQPKSSFELSFYAAFGEDYPVEWFDVSQWVFIGSKVEAGMGVKEIGAFTLE